MAGVLDINCSVFFLEFDKRWNEVQVYSELTNCQSESYQLFISQLRSGDEIHTVMC